jgi:transcriptional regulator with XRE-family HTH domain
MSKLGDLFKSERMKKGISQNKLAKKLGLKNGQIISSYERGVCYPPTASIKKIAKILGVKTEMVIFAWCGDEVDKIYERMNK